MHKEQQWVACSLCCEPFNKKQRTPIFLCTNQHFCCQNCYKELFRVKGHPQKNLCPFCKSTIWRKDFSAFRILPDIIAHQQRESKIKEELLKRLQEENKKYDEMQSKYKQMEKIVSLQAETLKKVREENKHLNSQIFSSSIAIRNRQKQIRHLKNILKTIPMDQSRLELEPTPSKQSKKKKGERQVLIFDLEKSIILPQIVPRKWSAPKDLSQTIFQQQRKSKSSAGKTQRFKTSIEQK